MPPFLKRSALFTSNNLPISDNKKNNCYYIDDSEALLGYQGKCISTDNSNIDPNNLEHIEAEFYLNFNKEEIDELLNLMKNNGREKDSHLTKEAAISQTKEGLRAPHI
jgi:hypothetical protein